MPDLVDPLARTRSQADQAWLERLKYEGVPSLLSAPSKPPFSFYQGVEEFNQGQYWQAHETLENLWRETPYPLRLFYYALIKLDVGLLHLGRHNAAAARRQLVVAADFLEPFMPTLLGIQTDSLHQEARVWLQRLDKVWPTNASHSSGRHIRPEDSSIWAEFDRIPRAKIRKVAVNHCFF